jgi:hypothetical protein
MLLVAAVVALIWANSPWSVIGLHGSEYTSVLDAPH